MDATAAVGIGAGVVGACVAVVTGMRAISDLTRGSRLRARLKDYAAIRAQLPAESEGSAALLVVCERLIKQLVRIERRPSRVRLLQPAIALMILAGAGVLFAVGVQANKAEQWKYAVGVFLLELAAFLPLGPTAWRRLGRRFRRLVKGPPRG